MGWDQHRRDQEEKMGTKREVREKGKRVYTTERGGEIHFGEEPSWEGRSEFARRDKLRGQPWPP